MRKFYSAEKGEEEDAKKRKYIVGEGYAGNKIRVSITAAGSAAATVRAVHRRKSPASTTAP
jgi:hypothetical protein